MAETTPVLGLPEIEENQSAKYLTHNEALVFLETLAAGVKSRSNGSVPASPGSRRGIELFRDVHGDRSTAPATSLCRGPSGPDSCVHVPGCRSVRALWRSCCYHIEPLCSFGDAGYGGTQGNQSRSGSLRAVLSARRPDGIADHSSVRFAQAARHRFAGSDPHGRGCRVRRSVRNERIYFESQQPTISV